MYLMADSLTSVSMVGQYLVCREAVAGFVASNNVQEDVSPVPYPQYLEIMCQPSELHPHPGSK